MTQLRKPKISEEIKLEIIKAYDKGMPVSDILKTFNISVGTLYRIIKKTTSV